MNIIPAIAATSILAVIGHTANSSTIYEFDFKAVLTNAVFHNAYYLDHTLEEWDPNYLVDLGNYSPQGEFYNGSYIGSQRTEIGNSLDGYVKATLDSDLRLESFECLVAELNCILFSIHSPRSTHVRMPSLGTFEFYYFNGCGGDCEEYSLAIDKDGGSFRDANDGAFSSSDELFSFYYVGYTAFYTFEDVVQLQPLPGCEPSGFKPPKCEIGVVPVPAALPLAATTIGAFASLLLARSRRRLNSQQA